VFSNLLPGNDPAFSRHVTIFSDLGVLKKGNPKVFAIFLTTGLSILIKLKYLWRTSP
jgi:hypothetical protein